MVSCRCRCVNETYRSTRSPGRAAADRPGNSCSGKVMAPCPASSCSVRAGVCSG
ncbi:Uncharacterised protein [Bordetella pertussis]|nr:Uncharacterised protein [Bordetella pertussis]